jgi:siderophore ferric iron reductase
LEGRTLTARNYLFAPDQDDAALARFIETGARVTGFLKGAPGGGLPGWYRAGEDNQSFLTTLYERLEQSYPEAGQPFYAVRLWTNLVWQPAYLAVIAVHLHGAVPDFSSLSQSRQNVDVNGYRLQAKPMRRGTVEEMIALAGADLRAFGDQLLGEINAVTRLKRLPALRLLTDRMLGLMVQLRQYLPGLDIAEQQRFCDLWLAAMGLEGQGSLERLTLDDGFAVLITARKGCCLDYLAFPGTYCSSCPKQDDDLRHARQRQVVVEERLAAG